MINRIERQLNETFSANNPQRWMTEIFSVYNNIISA